MQHWQPAICCWTLSGNTSTNADSDHLGYTGPVYLASVRCPGVGSVLLVYIGSRGWSCSRNSCIASDRNGSTDLALCFRLVFGHPAGVPALNLSKSKRQSCPCDPARLGTPFQNLLAVLACSNDGCGTDALGIGNTFQKALACKNRLNLMISTEGMKRIGRRNSQGQLGKTRQTDPLH